MIIKDHVNKSKEKEKKQNEAIISPVKAFSRFSNLSFVKNPTFPLGKGDTTNLVCNPDFGSRFFYASMPQLQYIKQPGKLTVLPLSLFKVNFGEIKEVKAVLEKVIKFALLVVCCLSTFQVGVCPCSWKKKRRPLSDLEEI